MCGYRFRSCYSDPGEKFYLAASPLLGPAEDLSAAADITEVFCELEEKNSPIAKNGETVLVTRTCNYKIKDYILRSET